MYRNSTSRVRNRGLLSEPLPIGHGSRQGGKSSTLFYLIYINGLIEKVEESDNGRCIYDINMTSPSVADDMVLVTYSKNGLDRLLKISYEYAGGGF
ncbi:hypothetical protein DPMN_100564 [Dreissena polymorpha]|uniref:Uncharacterized protein n=1 Tax=Dreissena polymorpha TaxID=45954 RepID=A0A9D4LHA3_DREPO|nr:hypothetical protein DPMN_100564 [Dreissena polymorpha]